MDALCDDLTAEHADLDRIVTADDLGVATPAPGWSVGDQISHLWFFDQRAMLALTDPDGFARDAEQIRAALAGEPHRSVGRAGPRPRSATSCSSSGGATVAASSTTPARSTRGPGCRGTARR